ncbi:hypothetical protein A2U01_0037480, partial [Trifolium medium]|nr:hypothetical protein [Trifolium medium]
AIIDGAAQFFHHFFSAYERWDREIMPFQRGAWLRLYGIPLHAWNDACLFEKEDEPQGSKSDYLEDYGDRDHRRNVDILVENIADAVALEDEVRQDSSSVHSDANHVVMGDDLGDPRIMVSEQNCRGSEVVITSQVDDAAVSESTTVSPVVLSQDAGVGNLA